ncbi:TAP42-like protein [Halteromyces radiatus]|uniref:TAP42-like protein n=1 Tax=Halteromyces radiatus TaxID=101107 RepID=UPI00221E7B6B|nr:TAP42-like protein [Halteromyces radiatus]KAI8081628.1 TAP42-like protein [Halteromyces radiatus]
MEHLTLGQLFSKGQTQLTFLEDTSLASKDPAYQAAVQEAIAALTRAQDLIERSAMFSSNELIDDINASDLKFLLTSVYLGHAVLKNITDDRATVLKRSKAHFEHFLSLCQDHQLMKQQDAEMYEKQMHGLQGSAAQQRQDKIARYKREKVLKETIQQLREQLDEEQQQKTALDKETERDYVVALIDLEILRAIEQLHSIEQEVVMVAEMEKMRQHMASSDDDQRLASREQQQDGSSKLDALRRTGGPLLSNEGKPLQPFIITNKRQQIKNQVFQPGYNLPTMTIDEYLQQEMDRGNIIKGGEEPKKEEIDDNDYDALDAETMKQRDWDEFKEANPRGWGNRGNKG